MAPFSGGGESGLRRPPDEAGGCAGSGSRNSWLFRAKGCAPESFEVLPVVIVTGTAQ